MSGTINLALSQQFDTQGDPLSGGLLYFFMAGTTTPQTPFQDTALTIAHPNPIVLDASGRVPMFYLADGFIKIRLTDKNGLVIIAADQLLVIGPSSGGGGGGGGGVDVTTVLTTGDIKARYGTGSLEGFVRCNGNTIGQTGSSAVELAGPKAQALYEYLWPFTNIVLDSATKGASAVADFGALKRLILPDLRGRAIAGMDDMGATAANRLTSAGFGASAIVLGAVGGTETKTLLTAQLPSHSHPNTLTVPNHTHANTVSETPHTHVINITGSPVFGFAGSGGSGPTSGSFAFDQLVMTPATAGVTITNAPQSAGVTITNATAGSGNAHSVANPAMVLTFYIKL